MNWFDIRNKRALVTGASRGLGYGIAEGFLRVGCQVALVGQSRRVLDVERQMRQEGLQAFAIRGDLGSREEISRVYEAVMERLGGVDILVNAAGIQRRHAFEDFPADAWDEVISVNLNAVFFLSQLAARSMIAQGHGKIIHIASMASWFGGITVAAYAASKGAVAQLTKAMANDLAPKGIQVNALAPGYMATDMNERLLADPKRYKEISGRIPAQRWGTPEDMVGPAIFLASSASDYLSGAVIPVDGGYLVR